MPWSDQNGGERKGSGSNGGNGGPWGQPPRGPFGGGNKPDLGDLIGKGFNQFWRAFGGGNGTGGGRPGGRGPAPLPSSFSLMVTVLALIVVAVWFSQCIYVVQPDEVGVVLRFGKAEPDFTEPGLHFALWPVDNVERAAVRRENQYDIGAASGSPNRQSNETGIMLSGDQNLVDVDFSVMWRIADPYKYLFSVAANRDVVEMVAEASMREYVGRTRADEFRTRGRSQAQDSVKDLIQHTLDAYGAGVTVLAVNLKRADPPGEVIDAFEEVQRAQQDQDKFRQDAQAYANKTLGDARGQAAQIRETAAGYKDRVIAEANGQAQQFTSVETQYAKAPEITRQRLYIETMSDVLAGVNKVIVDPKLGNGVQSYLPLPQLIGKP